MSLVRFPTAESAGVIAPVDPSCLQPWPEMSKKRGRPAIVEKSFNLKTFLAEHRPNTYIWLEDVNADPGIYPVEHPIYKWLANVGDACWVRFL